MQNYLVNSGQRVAAKIIIIVFYIEKNVAIDRGEMKREAECSWKCCLNCKLNNNKRHFTSH